MPRYLTSHNMTCMTRQGARAFAERLRAGGEVEFLRLLADLTGGLLICEFNAPSLAVLDRWLEKNLIHYQELHRIDLEATQEGTRDL